MAATPRLLLTRRWPDAVEARLAAQYDVTLNESDEPLSEAALGAAMQQYDVLCPTVSDRITATVIRTPQRRVRLIANYGAGVDHIDLDACRGQMLPVTNTPGVLTEATAEIAMTLMLMVARRAGEGEREAREERWKGWCPTHLLGTGLHGKRLGLIGFGRIAQAMAIKAHFGFGMNISYHARRQADHAIESRCGARYFADLDFMLETADFVAIHVPSTAETRGMINAARLARMKKGAFLINTARGDIVDHEALADRIEAGWLAGAALDVYPQEPIIPPRLLALENVVLLPHLGSATLETRTAMGMRTAQNIDAYFQGKPLPDLVK